MPVEENPPFLDVVKPHEQAGQGGFPSAGMPDNRDRLSGTDFERHIPKNPVPFGSPSICCHAAVISKPDVTELDFSLDFTQAERLLRLLDIYRGIQQLEDALRAGPGRLQDVVFLAEIGNGTKESFRVLNEGYQCTKREFTLKYLTTAVPDDQGDG